jgi:hypothetical protein
VEIIKVPNFKGKLLALPVCSLPEKLTRDKYSSLFCLFVSEEEKKKFYNIEIRSLLWRLLAYSSRDEISKDDPKWKKVPV